MANQLLIADDKVAVIQQNKNMYEQLNNANRVSQDSTYADLRDALMALNICRGMYKVLDGLGLTEEKNFVAEDIKRVEAKIDSILEEKRRKDRPKWRS